jgi:CheY-like chemotaxis protein/HPt (histidine-containing phosphotransfer) domain-containing protein
LLQLVPSGPAGNEHHLTIEVADTGIGIPEGQRHLLFKEFERFGTERASIEGTGLGLAISHRLVRRMGGSIGHRDNLGGGSVFWLDLPAGVADEVEPAIDVEETPRERQLSVLIVDDSDVNRQVAAAVLRRSQHMTTEAADGNEAVLLAATEDFDVVLMDMRMPGSDGLDATRRIRSLPGPRGQVPIVAMTANALDQHAEECRRAGMTEYLAKPFTEAELLAIVAKAAARRPRDRSSEQPIIDADAVFQLASTMGEEAVQRLFDCLAERIESLLRELEGPVALVTRDPAAELAHELVGSGGTLGFLRLASTAARFERAVLAGGSDCTEMRREAMAALYELRRRRSLAAMATD